MRARGSWGAISAVYWQLVAGEGCPSRSAFRPHPRRLPPSTPADVYDGRRNEIVERRKEVRKRTQQWRRDYHQALRERGSGRVPQPTPPGSLAARREEPTVKPSRFPATYRSVGGTNESLRSPQATPAPGGTAEPANHGVSPCYLPSRTQGRAPPPGSLE